MSEQDDGFITTTVDGAPLANGADTTPAAGLISQ